MSPKLDEIKHEIRDGKFSDMSNLSSIDTWKGVDNISVPLKVLGSKDSKVNYQERSAVRVIIQNKKGPHSRIAIMFSNKFNCYKLPGGGIEQADVDNGLRIGEHTHIVAAKRESKEETGIKVGGFYEQCHGIVEEWRGDLHQMNFLYCVDAEDENGERQLDDAEMGDLEKFEWVGVLEAVEMMAKAEPVGEIGNR